MVYMDDKLLIALLFCIEVIVIAGAIVTALTDDKDDVEMMILTLN